MEKLVEIGILFDFYGKLLSDRQYQVIDLYYIYDLSLAEIGEEMDITRQGVFDTLKRAELKLYEYEDTLGLTRKFIKIEDTLKDILQISAELKDYSKKNSLDFVYVKAQKIENIGKKFLD